MLLKGLKTNRMLLLKKFLKDKELVDLIVGKEGNQLPAYNLKCTQIFPYLWNDETVTEQKVFLRYTLTARTQTKTTVKFTLHFQVFMPKEMALVEDDDCLRADAIAMRLEEMLNGNELMGVKDVELVSLDEMRGLPKGFTGCYIQYSVEDINRLVSPI